MFNKFNFTLGSSLLRMLLIFASKRRAFMLDERMCKASVQSEMQWVTVKFPKSHMCEIVKVVRSQTPYKASVTKTARTRTKLNETSAQHI